MASNGDGAGPFIVMMTLLCQSLFVVTGHYRRHFITPSESVNTTSNPLTRTINKLEQNTLVRTYGYTAKNEFTQGVETEY